MVTRGWWEGEWEVVNGDRGLSYKIKSSRGELHNNANRPNSTALHT